LLFGRRVGLGIEDMDESVDDMSSTNGIKMCTYILKYKNLISDELEVSWSIMD